MRTHADRVRRGYTLLELVVALVLTGGTLLAASAMLSATARLTEAVQQEVARSDARRGSERLMRRLVGQATWPTEREPAPGGDGASLQLVSWCDTPEGWHRRCLVRFERSDSGEPTGLQLIVDDRKPQLLFPADTILAFIYLRSAAHGGSWDARWSDPATIPVAIGVVFASDTLVLRTGERG